METRSTEPTHGRSDIAEVYRNKHTGRKFKNPRTAHRSIFSTSMARCDSQEPFSGLKISSTTFLDEIERRGNCENCGKSRKFFCYTCYIPLPEIKELIPYIPSLPCHIDVIKHPNEHDGKSTSIHAAVVSPHMVKIYTFPNFPDYSMEDGVVLVYPCEGAVPMTTMVASRASEIKKMIFIDSTWAQSKQIYKDPRLKALPCVILRTRKSLFWRYQLGKPDSYLATIEAIYDAVVNLEERRRGNDEASSYDGSYDNLLFFFRYFYEKMNDLYFNKSPTA
ncbi:LOW QUALITY PROTEIN: tRNA-uridine aminocarboxypropyltransferase 1 [Daphnia magna]|uniref:LOW QUALITY PROTEIN: tRNA-uridine aminocarboxypropyltransferase 1 n=1 Tax=Daphnia magna TaxID=35525 RepID=UPI001E1BCF72|nr:LOW QUALITY PROTEIN: tRNA-uridine aminocarboxypropyltransferase 1 [Daphnia magna]